MSGWSERISKVGGMSELISNFSAMNAHDTRVRCVTTPLVERSEAAAVVGLSEAVA
jgi:hypothetical protein